MRIIRIGIHDVCNFQGANVAKYSQHIRDILTNSENGDLRNGMKLYSIFNDDLLESLYDNIPYLNTTMYHNNTANLFDAISFGDLSQVLWLTPQTGKYFSKSD